ncbi:MAG: hypothetical protein ACYCQI_05380 [Gammaproteobacteria bacterium]
MKNIVLLLSLIASSFVIASCTCQPAPQPMPEPAPVHHDYKGEANR